MESAMIPSPPWFRTSLLIGVAFLSQASTAQRGGAGASNNANRTAAPSRTTNSPDVTQPVFVSGRVLLEGGGVLPEPVAIERVSSGINRREGYTHTHRQSHFHLHVNVTFH